MFQTPSYLDSEATRVKSEFPCLHEAWVVSQTVQQHQDVQSWLKYGWWQRDMWLDEYPSTFRSTQKWHNRPRVLSNSELGSIAGVQLYINITGVILSLTLAGFSCLAVGHVVEDVLHGAAVGQGTGAHLSVGLLSPLALVGVKQQDQLLLDQFALLRVGRGACRHPLSRDHTHRGHLLLQLEERV